MLGLAALILTAASANASPALTPTSPWWEKVTYAISGDGARHSCEYQSSIGSDPEICDGSDSTPFRSAASGSAGVYTTITIERRFTPASQPDFGELEPGDTLLGGQVMALAIDGTGTVRGCEILAASGDIRPAYGCEEVRAERFEASAARAAPQLRQGFMTILVYGHEAHLA